MVFMFFTCPAQAPAYGQPNTTASTDNGTLATWLSGQVMINGLRRSGDRNLLYVCTTSTYESTSLAFRCAFKAHWGTRHNHPSRVTLSPLIFFGTGLHRNKPPNASSRTRACRLYPYLKASSRKRDPDLHPPYVLHSTKCAHGTLASDKDPPHHPHLCCT